MFISVDVMPVGRGFVIMLFDHSLYEAYKIIADFNCDCKT